MDIESIKLELSKKQKFMITSVICFFIALIGTTYAWIAHDFEGDSNAMNITSASVCLLYRGTVPGAALDIAPGETELKTFVVSNYSTEPLTYNLYWGDVTNSFVDKSNLFYTLEDTDTNEIVYIGYLPSSDVHILYDATIGSGETKEYELTVTYILDPENDQSANENKSFTGSIAVDQIDYSIEDIVTTYVDGVLNTSALTLSDYAVATGLTYCTYGASISVVNDAYQITNKTDKTTCEIYLSSKTDFTYTGAVQTFTAPANGMYNLEVWGASGGYAYTATYLGGYGSYSKGAATLQKDETIYIYVGGQGANDTVKDNAATAGGYNGGGNGWGYTDKYVGGGGGATHIATTSGLLSTLSSNQASILIVAGAGGGAAYETTSYYGYLGHGGGFNGVATTKVGATQTSLGGTQTAAGAGSYVGGFGYGATCSSNGCGGGGGGFYGGGAGNYDAGGSGGSGYIGNSNLTNKYMYCYNCATSAVSSTLTYTTTNYSATAVANYAKSGDGYATIAMGSTLYANSYNLLYVDLDGGTISTNPEGYYYVGDTLTISPPTKTGYIFNGWTIVGNGSSVNSNTITMGTTYTHLKANWNSIFTYMIGGNPAVSGTDYLFIDESPAAWRIKFFKSGVLKFVNNTAIDIFLVGGGGGGAVGSAFYGAGGAGGGYTTTYTNQSITGDVDISVVVGAGGSGRTTSDTAGGAGTISYFVNSSTYFANGGGGGLVYGAGTGGSGGGNGSGSNENNGQAGFSNGGGLGQGTTTKEFGETSGDLYSGGGGGAGFRLYIGSIGGAGGGGAGAGAGVINGTANTGGGGGGAGGTYGTSGNGGSGIVIIRNAR